jgi:F-type H+-transporting ATPase subunit gamma
MSGNMQSLRRKIDGAGDLQGVVGSMKALAASSIGQYERAVRSLDDYYRTVKLGLSVCLRQAEAVPVAAGKRKAQEDPHREMRGAVVFGSDQGLVGRFNEVLVEFAISKLKSLPGKTKRIWAVGERVQELLADTGLTQAGVLSIPNSVNAITPLIGRILIDIQAARERGEVVAVYLFHNRPKSESVYEPVSKRLLPLDLAWQNKLAALPWPTKSLPEVIEGPAGGAMPTLQAFIREYLFVLLFQACAESLASENGSRLAAMQRAEKNIKEILEDLNRKFFRIRQEAIDEELFDVVAGFEALKGSARATQR